MLARWVVAMASVGVLALVGSPVRAQSAAGTETAESLAPISVTATRNPIESFDYPGMVSVIGRDEMNRNQPSTLDDLLRDVPGITFTGGPRRTGEVPAIRGFSGADVILMLDGARQNFSSGHDGRIFVDPFFLRQAEVVRGSSSALYGSGGTGGVMEFRTLEAGDLIGAGKDYGVEIGTGLQSVNDEWANGVVGAMRFNPATTVLGGLVLRNSGSIRLGSEADLLSDDDILSGLFKARTGWAHNSLEVSANRFTNDAKEPNNGQSTGNDIVAKDIRSDTFRVAYGFKDPANRWLDLDALVYHVNIHETEVRLDDNGEGPEGQVQEQLLTTSGLRVDNRTRLPVADNIFTVLTYGVEGYRDEGEGREDGGPRDGVPDAKAWFGATFAHAQIEFENLWGEGTGITLLPGLRYDRYTSESSGNSDNTSDEISPKIAVQVRPVRPLSIFGSWARAFRAPSLGELYPSGTHFSIPGFGVNSFIPNPDLRPQTTDTFEAGLGLRFRDVLDGGDTAQVKGSHYWMTGKNFIDLVVIQPGPPACFPPNCNGTTQSVNVANARLNGYEIEANYDHSNYLLAASFAHIDGEDEDTGEPLGVLTPDTLSLHAAYRIPQNRLQVGWRFVHADDFTNTSDASLRRESYDLHHAYVQWRAGGEDPLAGLGVTFGIDNIFDKDYARVANSASEPGRNFKVTVNYRTTW